jgi:hypothetical protein
MSGFRRRPPIIAFAGMATAGCAIALLLVTCSASDIPLVGPCAASKRIAPDKTSYDLALTRVVRDISRVDDYPLRSEEDRSARPVQIAKYRAETVPKIADSCLRAHTDEWISFYAAKVQGMAVAAVEPEGFEQREAEKADQRRALAAKLGVSP